MTSPYQSFMKMKAENKIITRNGLMSKADVKASNIPEKLK